MCPTQTRRRAGLETVSPRGLAEDELVERELRDGLPQPLVLQPEVLHALDPVRLQAAILPPPA